MISPNHGISPHDVSVAASKTCAAHHKNFPNPALLPAAQTLQPCISDSTRLSPFNFVSTPSATHSTHCGSVSFQLLLPLTQSNAVSNARAVLRMSIRMAKLSAFLFVSFFHIHQQAKTEKKTLHTNLNTHKPSQAFTYISSHPHQHLHTRESLRSHHLIHHQRQQATKLQPICPLLTTRAKKRRLSLPTLKTPPTALNGVFPRATMKRLLMMIPLRSLHRIIMSMGSHLAKAAGSKLGVRPR